MACRSASRLCRPWAEATRAPSSSSTRPSSALLLCPPHGHTTPLRLRQSQHTSLQKYSSTTNQFKDGDVDFIAGDAATIPPSNSSEADSEQFARSSARVPKLQLRKAGLLDEVISEEYKATPSGQLIRRRMPKASLTLEEFRQLKSRTPPLPHLKGTGRRAWQQAREDATYLRTFKEVSAALGVDQLRLLARTAGIEVNYRTRKSLVVQMLLEDQLGLISPERRLQKDKAERVERRIPVSRTELFLLLVNSGRSLEQMVAETGASLTPDARVSTDGEPEYALVASGQEDDIGRAVDVKLNLFKASIKEVVIPLQVQVEALNHVVLDTISARTRTAIETISRSTEGGEPAVRLTAINYHDISVARLQLGFHQADLFETPTPLASYAQPSPLDPGYNEYLSQGSLQHFAFLPTATPSVTPWLTDIALGGSEAPGFRLTNVKETGKGTDQQNLGKSFVGLDSFSSPPRPSLSLKAADNWQWLEERLDLSEAEDCVHTLPFQPAGAVASTTHTLSLGSLVFPGNVISTEPALSELQRLLNPPLSGNWTLDTAFEWLRRRPTRQDGEERPALWRNPRRPFWFNDQLAHIPVDGTGTITSRMAEVVDTGRPAKEGELIRVVYRLGSSRAQDPTVTEGELLWKLHIDIKEELVPKHTQKIETVGQSEVEAESYASKGNEATESSDTEADELSMSTLAHAQSSESMYIYSITSAYWSTTKKVNVLAPDVRRDFQLSSTINVPMDLRALDESGSFATFLNRLARQVDQVMEAGRATSPVAEEDKGFGKKFWMHPRQGHVPVPLPHRTRTTATPPPFISLPRGAMIPRGTKKGASPEDAVLHLETLARLSSTAYPLRSRPSDRGSKGEEGRLITETHLSNLYTAPMTSSRVEWSSIAGSASVLTTHKQEQQQQDGTEIEAEAKTTLVKGAQEEPGSPPVWQHRLNSVEPLTRIAEH